MSKKGDVIFPAYNGTGGLFNKSRWDIVADVDETGKPTHIICVDDYSIIRTLEIIKRYPWLIKNDK